MMNDPTGMLIILPYWWSNSHADKFIQCTYYITTYYCYYAPDCKEEGNKRCFCPYLCPSVCLCVRPSRTYRIIPEREGLACPNMEGRFPTLNATGIPVSRSNGQRSGLEGVGAYRVGGTRRSRCLLLLLLFITVCNLSLMLITVAAVFPWNRLKKLFYAHIVRKVEFSCSSRRAE